jgi:anti-sigma28 factor (negative regulator of flagellin synthesis)
VTGTISLPPGANSHLDTSSTGSVPATPSKVSAVSTQPTESMAVVLPLVDPKHQIRLQALTNQVQSGQYPVQPQKVAAAWLKTVR